MQKHYCIYELSMLAKKSGFDELCLQGYEKETFFEFKKEFTNTYLNKEYGKIYAVTAPELTVLQQWVYEKFGVWVNVLSKFVFTEPDLIPKQYFYMEHIDLRFDCPYKALDAGLLEFLKSKV